MKNLLSVVMTSHFLLLCQCVGPTTPFGALNVFDFSAQRQPASAAENTSFSVHFHPERKVYHDKSDLSFEIKNIEPITDDIEIRVYHNGIDVTYAFLNGASIRLSADGKSRMYLINNVRLKTLDHNDIQVRVVKNGRVLAHGELAHPDCFLFAKQDLATYGPFQVPDSYMTMIENIAENANTNPSFLAGIVAQESSFNPNAVSWAKAIGLTQVTPIAEEQVLNKVSEWPRYPGINSLSYVTLKSKIYLGEINDQSEWRLDPEKSLRGGIAYIQYLNDYWSLEQNKKLISELDGDQNRIYSEIILASYNSGAGRVKNAVVANKNNWKQHESLKEALRYLKKVSSYCYHYTKKEVKNDNET